MNVFLNYPNQIYKKLYYLKLLSFEIENHISMKLNQFLNFYLNNILLMNYNIYNMKTKDIYHTLFYIFFE